LFGAVMSFRGFTPSVGMMPGKKPVKKNQEPYVYKKKKRAKVP